MEGGGGGGELVRVRRPGECDCESQLKALPDDDSQWEWSLVFGQLDEVLKMNWREVLSVLSSKSQSFYDWQERLARNSVNTTINS